MEQGPPVPRRDVLSIMGLLLAGTVSPTWPSGFQTADDSVDTLLDQMLDGNTSICRIGMAYLKRCAEESEPPNLGAAAIGLSSHESLHRWRQSGAVEVEAHVRHRIRTDFGDGKTFVCDGWVLSLTEARLCAAAIVGMSTLRRREGEATARTGELDQP